MKLLCLFLLLLCALYSADDEDIIIELTDSDFSSVVADKDVILVMFYAQWCGHCKKIKPHYQEAAEILKKSDPPVVVAKIDCSEGGKVTCDKYSVTGYPTLKIFRNGQPRKEFSGSRDVAGILKYVRLQLEPSFKELFNLDDVQRFLAHNDVSVLGFFKNDSEMKSAFLATAEKQRENVRFGHSKSDDVSNKFGVNDGIVLFRPNHLHNKFEDNEITYVGGPNTDDISQFIKKNYHGLVGHRKTDNQVDFPTPLVIAYYNVDYVRNIKGTNYWRNRIIQVAKHFSDDFIFVISAKEEFQEELNDIGIGFGEGDKPVIFARDKNNNKFIMREEFSMEAFETFLNNLKGANLEPYLKSDPIPETNDGPVKVAVANNFNEVVINNEKDTLIAFYAPWCGHCKKLFPIYEELGYALADENVEIVMMDASSNDVPAPFDVRGFPTIYWTAKEKKNSPEIYEGDRNLNSILKYIAKRATNELKGFDRNGKAKKLEL